MDPLVSIITPVYNAEPFLAETVNSVLVQSYENWELFLLDDGSSDRSRDMIKSFAAQDDRIRAVFLTGNEGAARTRNAGIQLANGRFIAFLDSDDVWFAEKLPRQIPFMIKNDISFCLTDYCKMSEDGSIVSEPLGMPAKMTYEDLLVTCVIGCLTSVYDMQHHGKVYMPNLKRGQDYGLWLRLLKQTEFAFALQECLAKYRIRKNSISSNKLRKAIYQWKIYREIENIGLLKSVWYFSHYAAHGLLKWLH